MASLNKYSRIVIKIGSSLLVDGETGKLRLNWLKSLSKDIFELKKKNKDVVVVSSGAIALGRATLGLLSAKLPLEESQAAAAVGQIRLARAYEEILAPHNITAAQVLVTLEDSQNRKRYLNSRATFEQLLSLGVVPIVNENDTVATEEIRYGDNDRLAAQVAATVGADLVILLSDVDGLYTSDPSLDKNAKHIPEVLNINSEIEVMGGDANSVISRGGMKTKIMAAKLATAGGASLVIMEGSMLNPIENLKSGVKCTWFRPKEGPQAARKSWISSMKSLGKITIDSGAKKALDSGKSLLPAGVTGVVGNFERGDPVQITGLTGNYIAIGLSRYSSTEAKKLIGVQLIEIENILGYPGRTALVHRDDMAK